MFRRTVRVACVIAVLGVTAAVSAATLNWTTYFTFNKPVRAAGVLLPPGEYVFEITNPATSSDVVRIADRKKAKTYVMAITRRITRPAASRLDAVIVMGEASPTAPRPIRAWYPAGVTTGYEFLK